MGAFYIFPGLCGLCWCNLLVLWDYVRWLHSHVGENVIETTLCGPVATVF